MKKQLEQDIIELKEAVGINLLNAAREGNEPDVQKAFLHARLAYKKIELLTEYYAPGPSRYLNGPPLPEMEIE